MEDYPRPSLDHNIPSILLLGLSQNPAREPSFPAELNDQAILLRSELTVVETKHAKALHAYIQGRDASDAPWNDRDPSSRYRFRVLSAGRTFHLPPRRARLPEDLDGDSQPPGALHSPFSPLSPCCRLYPDGILDGSWLAKHQELVPSLFLCFYELTADPTLATLHDNQIKTDINTIRSALTQSGYKSRVAAVLLSGPRPSSTDGVQERLENIRKGCALDPKSLFLLPAPSTQEDLERAADAMLAGVYAHSVEYYRDLGRRARKKKGRSVVPQPTVPPTSGTSQTLPLAGWNVRYDFKSAVFAEFRQEMDQALRYFEQAYESLLGPDILEMIPSWSPRWNEARQLADIISIRSLRCLLWNGQSSAAVRRWQAHRDRIGDLIDRRGRGTTNYGWRAWEARWALVMAGLLDKVGFAELAATSPALFLSPEKPVMGERLQPWEMLHHPGYWYRAAARHLFARRTLAYAMPEDDRRAPDESPASKSAGKAFTYDTYMCPEPHEEFPLPVSGGAGGVRRGVDHSKLIVECLAAARQEFQRRGQTRLAAELAIECAREYAAARQWRDALDLLLPVWQDAMFRADGWLDIGEEVAWMLRTVARETGQAGLQVSIDWELLNSKYTQRRNWHYDLAKSLDSVSVPGAYEKNGNDGSDGTGKKKPCIKITDESSLPLLATSFVFRVDEGKAGQTCQAQLAITSNAFPSSVALLLQSIRVEFEGSIKPVWLRHDDGEPQPQLPVGNVAFKAVYLREESAAAYDVMLENGTSPMPALPDASVLVGSCDLTLLPAHIMVYEVGIPLREPGEAKALSATFFMSCDTFDVEHTATFRESGRAGDWHGPHGGKPKKISRADPHAIRIQPRPPNMEIRLLNPLEQYYTNEAIDLQFDVVNAEDVDAIVKLDVLLVGDEPPGFRLLIAGKEIATAAPDAEQSKLVSLPLGSIATSGVVELAVRIERMELPATYDLTLRASYGLVSDLATPIEQTAVFRLPLTNPFEANYDLLPRLNPDPWPSLFDPEGVEALAAAAVAASGGAEAGEIDSVGHVQPRGLTQTWCLVTRYASFALEDLRVADLDVLVAPAHAVRCRTAKRQTLPDTEGLLIKPKTIEEAQFDITAQKLSLDEREPVGLDVSFVIRWSRLGGGAVNTTRLPVPRLMIFGSEPRVLASVSYLEPPAQPESGTAHEDGDMAAAAPASGAGAVVTSADGLVILDIVVENASNHFLTFGLSMEPSNDFAFSGSKMTTMHLLPISRRSTTYRLLPLVRGAWIKPNLTVRDKYFQKVLRVIPTEGMKLDKDGFLVWVPPLADDEA